jgi:hypothetical protein
MLINIDISFSNRKPKCTVFCMVQSDNVAAENILSIHLFHRFDIITHNYSFLLALRKFERNTKGPVRVVSTLISKCTTTLVHSRGMVKHINFVRNDGISGPTTHVPVPLWLISGVYSAVLRRPLLVCSCKEYDPTAIH